MASAAATAAAQGDEDAAASSAAIASAIDPPADGNEVVVPDPVQLFAPDYEGSHGRVATIVPSPVRASKAQRTVAGRSTTAHAKKPVTASSPRRKKRGSIAPPSPSRGRMTRAAALVANAIAASDPTGSPSERPTLEPSASPTKKPTSDPTREPTQEPSEEPTPEPTRDPTERPTPEPTNDPTRKPSRDPTGRPTPAPSREPTNDPTGRPTPEPTSDPTRRPTDRPTLGPTTDAPTPYEPFFFGDEFVTYDNLGIEVSKGLSVRVVAREGRPVPYADGGESKLDYHEWTDAAGIIPTNPDNPTEGGYVYVANSEDSNGGVYGIYFDGDGNVLEYKALLRGTTDNCGGGHTPWNTWVSCEEYEDGQCWEVDPVNGRARETRLGGRGGRYESVACDDSEPSRPVFFTTEDDETGALRRFAARGAGWGALHSDGDESFLLIKDGRNFEWTADESAARRSAARYYRNSEGIQYHEGRLYFMAKKDRKMIILDLDEMTYETEITGKKFYGEGSFGAQPDQNVFGPTRKYIYFTEDGGSSPGVYARFGEEGTFFTMFQAISGGVWDGDETVGIALSPDNKRFYAGIQLGIIFEFTRDDGLPFE